MLPCGKAVNPPIVRRNIDVSRRLIEDPVCLQSRQRRAKGQKSYWERFHGDVSVIRTHGHQGHIWRVGQGLHQRFGERFKMSTLAATEVRSGGMTKDERFVILASSLGTVFEWYDFYLYGSLASIIGAQFFSAYPPATRDIFALLAFAAGFLVRPFG